MIFKSGGMMNMKPLIGISASMEIEKTYYMTATDNVEAILAAGGMPMVLPMLEEDKAIDELARRLDGLYLTGGYDIDPTIFGEEPHPKLGTIIPIRDSFEMKMVLKMRELQKPILGVCRGCQIMNIAIGGDMYQDIYSQHDQQLLQHSQNAPKEHRSHFVNVEKDSLLYKLVGKTKLPVNSRHHQANRFVPENFRASGIANDGIVEAIESKNESFFLGVQWHPENLAVKGIEEGTNIFNGFIEACKRDEGETD